MKKCLLQFTLKVTNEKVRRGNLFRFTEKFTEQCEYLAYSKLSCIGIRLCRLLLVSKQLVKQNLPDS